MTFEDLSMSAPDTTLPSLSELEDALEILRRTRKDDDLIAVLRISKIQDMFQQTLHIGDIDHYGAMQAKLKSKPRAQHGGEHGLIAAAYKKFDSALEMMVMGASMSPDGKLKKAERSFPSYLNLPSTSYIAQECKNFSLKASWGDYLDLIKYLTQDSENIHDIHLRHCSEAMRKDRLNDIACSFSLYVGRDIGDHLTTLLRRTLNRTIPAPVVDLLREQEDRFTSEVMKSLMNSSESLMVVDHYKSAGLLKLAEATLESSKRALFMRPDHFLKLAEHGIVFDDAWHAEQFNERKESAGTAIPQLIYHLCAGGTYCPPLAEIDEKKRSAIVVECCNSSYPRSPEIFTRVKSFLEDYVKDVTMAQELINAGLDTDIAKHVKIMLPLAFSKDLGL
jgi:hypothetical protein